MNTRTLTDGPNCHNLRQSALAPSGYWVETKGVSEVGHTLVKRSVSPSRGGLVALRRRFQSRVVINTDLDRTLVSFQANRREPFQNWFKYREGFSVPLVDYVIDELTESPGTILDPFAGVGTALFSAQARGWDCIGIELMPVGFAVMQARISARRVKHLTYAKYLDMAERCGWGTSIGPKNPFQHIAITEGAFEKTTEKAWSGFQAFCRTQIKNPHVRRLFLLASLAILEDISYTRKDGQYLRWDSRAPRANLRSAFQKGEIKTFERAIKEKLGDIYSDLSGSVSSQASLFESNTKQIAPGTLDIRLGSCLDLLPRMESDSVDLVVTSPPYCNRYDYTRTYALELAALGYDSESVKALRQCLLSCTVENRSKEEQLRRFYANLDREEDFIRVSKVFTDQSALFETVDALNQSGRLNNPNVPRMVRNYFFETAFVLYELSRVVRSGGRVVMVNDNVQYAGIEIPVDLILSSIAEGFGFETSHVWVLPRGKGNSSQQMGEHGRTELRKSVLVWNRE